jgi:hypothetical protein
MRTPVSAKPRVGAKTEVKTFPAVKAEEARFAHQPAM